MSSQPKRFHLCQANVGLMKAPLDSPLMQEFKDNLEPINALADRSPGFVWRLQTETGDATSIQLFDNPLIIYNMSVWESTEALFDYTYHSDHTKFMANRSKWFSPYPMSYLVLWWIEAGQLPERSEGKHRLEYLDQHGPSSYAFTLKQVFQPLD